jgi:hypothetical protein
MNLEKSEQVAALRYQELASQGLHEQFIASVLPPLAGASVARTLLKQLGALLVRVRVGPHDVDASPDPWLAPGAVGEWGASASSHEPMNWLSPCRLP